MLKKLFGSQKTKQLRYIVKTLEKRQHENIRADLDGYKKPQNVVNKNKNISFTPDMTSSKDGTLRIFSSITKSELEDSEISDKWTLFAEFAKQNNAIFHIAFPPELYEAVVKMLESTKIEASLWDISKQPQ